MAILVVQSASGTTQLHGSAADPINVPGNNWTSSIPAIFVRKSGGGVLIPNSNNSATIHINVGTARQKITLANVVLNGNYIRFHICVDAAGSTPFGGGSGYSFYVTPGGAAYLEKWNGSGAPVAYGSNSSTLPSAPITITTVYIEHLSPGTINARAVIGGTNYNSTLSDGSPLTGTFAGLFASNNFATGIPADSITIEDNTSTYTYARPTSDITTQWTPSTGTDHFALIDETTASDADYIIATAAGQTDEVRLASMTAPQAGTDLLINYRVQGIVGSATVTMSLRQGSGGTLIATDTAKNTNNTYQLVVPAATWASVTDWTDLRLRFVSA